MVHLETHKPCPECGSQGNLMLELSNDMLYRLRGGLPLYSCSNTDCSTVVFTILECEVLNTNSQSQDRSRDAGEEGVQE